MEAGRMAAADADADAAHLLNCSCYAIVLQSTHTHTHTQPIPTQPNPQTVYLIYLWAVRPYGIAVVGAFEAAAALCTLCMCGLVMALMDGRGSSDLTR